MSRTKPSTRESAVPAAITALAETSRRAVGRGLGVAVAGAGCRGVLGDGGARLGSPTVGVVRGRRRPSSVAGAEPSAPSSGAGGGLGCGPAHRLTWRIRSAVVADQHDPGDDGDRPAGRAVLGHPHLDRDRAADLAAGLGVAAGRRPGRCRWPWPSPRALPVKPVSGREDRRPRRARVDRLDHGEPLRVVGARRPAAPGSPPGRRCRRRPRGARSLRMVIGNSTPSRRDRADPGAAADLHLVVQPGVERWPAAALRIGRAGARWPRQRGARRPGDRGVGRGLGGVGVDQQVRRRCAGLAAKRSQRRRAGRRSARPPRREPG